LRTGFPIGDSRRELDSLPLPIETDPSYRYLPSRVLTLLPYDAYWLRQASNLTKSPRPSRQQPNVHFRVR
jgi:hypothetical protein